ncbi:NAD-dependent epimerase/dehydratase family protein [Gemmatimonadota bacterium]
MKILVTGAKGFIGKNLVVTLRRDCLPECIWEYDIGSSSETLKTGLAQADIVFHLAGVNRPERNGDFFSGNTDLTREVCNALGRREHSPVLVLSSSTQAELNNPYGISKKGAEEAVFDYAKETGATIAVFRLPGIFGKWSRPNYNSVVATFCHNIARDLPVSISDPTREIDLVYIDDVVKSFLKVMDGLGLPEESQYLETEPVYRVTLGKLAETIRSFRDIRKSLLVPDQSDRFTCCLHATYISFLPPEDLAYSLITNEDQRGGLAELIKSPCFGQIFVSRTKPGITRGNHYHDTKVEKFAVLSGEAVVRFRHVLDSEVIEYSVTGDSFQVIDIPPGYTHNITNIGDSELIVLFWSNELFDRNAPDTHVADVREE